MKPAADILWQWGARRRTALAVLCMIAVSPTAHAQCEGLKGADFTRCKYAQGEAEIGGVRNPSTTSSSSGSPQPSKEQGRGPGADQDAYKQAVAREVREHAEKVAAMKPLGEGFQRVFDDVNVEKYGGYVFSFRELNTTAHYTIGSSDSSAGMQATRRDNADFLGPLYLRMAVACVELEWAGRGKGCTESAMSYLWQARDLGYPDANEIMDQIVTLGLDSLFPADYRGSLAGGAQDWRRASSSGRRPQLVVSPRIDLAERQRTYAVRLQAERERDATSAREAEEAARQNAAAESARMEEVRRQRLAAQSTTIQRILKTVDARWRAASIDYPLLAPLPRQKAASLLNDAATALERYEDGVVRRGSQPKQVRGVELMKAAFASGSCSPGAAANCMRLLVEIQEADNSYRDDYMNIIKHHVAVVECHARRVALACRLADFQPPQSEGSDAQRQAKELAYMTMSCVSPGEMKGFFNNRCSIVAYKLLSGGFGSPDAALANDLYRIACALGEDESCEKVPARVSGAAGPG